jgi:hypothetical protein
MEQTSGDYLVFQSLRYDGVWYDRLSSQWNTEQYVRKVYELSAGEKDVMSRLIRRTVKVIETETVVS